MRQLFMEIIHGLWSPEATGDFFDSGHFYVWVERDQKKKGNPPKSENPYQIPKSDLPEVLNQIGVKIPYPLEKHVLEARKITLPCRGNVLLPSPSIELDTVPEGEIRWRNFEVTCARIGNPLAFLKDIHFLSFYFPKNIKLGRDLEFWIRYAQVVGETIKKDHYVPALRHQKKGGKINLYASWNLISQSIRDFVEAYSPAMPSTCVAAAESESGDDVLRAYDRKDVLWQFAEVSLSQIIRDTKFTQKLQKTVEKTFVGDALWLFNRPFETEKPEELLKQWNEWREGVGHGDYAVPFYLCFRLNAADPSRPGHWTVEMLIESKKDPSFKIPLSEFWRKKKSEKKLVQYFGKETEKNILILLGHASRIFPKLLSGLNTAEPSCINLSLEEAFEFLREDAAILQNAGYKVMVPSWWTAKGQGKIKIRLRATAKPSSGQSSKSGLFGADAILNFEYELAMGGEPVSKEEFQNLVEAKQPLVHFRGEWIEIDNAQMSGMLDFMNRNAGRIQEADYLELFRKMSAEEAVFEFSADRNLEKILGNLSNPEKFEIIETPKTFNGQLREYQKRGFSWLSYLENLGLNPCLADDMGLGKTIQVIALLAREKAENRPSACLLIVPTSVLGNWQKEINNFAPGLKSLIHHGSDRIQEEKEFIKTSGEHDAIITSFALIRKDHGLFKEYLWNRIIVDEAQNIKNPKSAQCKAILSLKSNSRIALTGTPIENRLMDLWSIMNFLNPSYLGTQAEFRKKYELPIQRNNDRAQSVVLKKLVEPFILRREKTDKSIIDDLPDKVEQKIFCNLNKEQASLYEAVVKDVSDGLENSEPGGHQGIMLSALMRLKQICNHPAQFLQDNSKFSPDRSHKLARLLDMVDEVLENGESLLIFSQFKEIGDELAKLLKKELKINPFFLHGGVSGKKRQTMIENFQNPETEPSVFILSLKAGGVGITLTKANHVFHFDRWWNPAVENQATDRAYRIGQKKKVMVHKFVTLGTLEEKIDEMIEQKKKLSDNILGNSESWLANLDVDSFRELIKLSKTAVLE